MLIDFVENFLNFYYFSYYFSSPIFILFTGISGRISGNPAAVYPTNSVSGTTLVLIIFYQFRVNFLLFLNMSVVVSISR